ncbi:hypothetical protein CHCC20375_3677 [Bacillus licheniformis]|nr:hypothetical protein CHCC20375_3677 [Bacillus licheniformis]
MIGTRKTNVNIESKKEPCGRFFNAGMGDTPIPDQMMYE